MGPLTAFGEDRWRDGRCHATKNNYLFPNLLTCSMLICFVSYAFGVGGLSRSGQAAQWRIVGRVGQYLIVALVTFVPENLRLIGLVDRNTVSYFVCLGFLGLNGLLNALVYGLQSRSLVQEQSALLAARSSRDM